MFDSLEDRIKLDEHIQVSRKERIAKIATIIVLSIVLFGGLYYAIRLIE